METEKILKKRLFRNIGIAVLIVSLFFSFRPTSAKADSGLQPPQGSIALEKSLNKQAQLCIHVHGAATSAPTGLSPAQIRMVYNLPSTGGTGTIALIDPYDDPTVQSDLNVFSSQFGLPATDNTNFEKHMMSPTITVDPHWAQEISLDVQWAHAIAPNARIVLVEAASSNLSSILDAVDYARNRADVKAVSMSWYFTEFPTENSSDSHFTSDYGATFFAASGDSGAGAVWPAASPNVVGVGGTTLNFSASGVLTSETAWSSSGGGLSAFEAEPSYQVIYGVSGAGGKRAVPDVSYDADPNSGVSVYDSTAYLGQSGWLQFGGTSAGTPQWAAIQSLGLSASNNNFYQDAKLSIYSTCFRDITSGSNGNYATVGYDLVTGLGSPLTTNYNPAPVLISPASGTFIPGTSVTYSWNSVPGASLYSIYVSTAANFNTTKFNTLTNGLSVTDTGYSNNSTKYYWVVYAYNGFSWSPASTAWSFTNGLSAPTLVSPGNSNNVSGTSVTYSWNADAGATFYSIYVATTPNFTSIKFNTVTSGLSVTDSGYSNNGTTYYWVVYAYNGISWSPASAVWSFINISQPLTLVSPLNNSTVSGTSITYSWNAVPGATFYSIYVSTTPNFTAIKFNTVISGLSVTDTGYPNNGTTYYWVVYAYSGFSWSPASMVWSFVNGSFSAPTLVSPGNSNTVSGTSVTYSWNPVAGATVYSIYVSTTPNFTAIKFNTVTSGLSVTDTGYSNNGSTYYWVVYAWNGSRWGPPSPVWNFVSSFSANLVSPANVAFVSGTSVTYSWNAVPGATFYTIYVSTTPNFNNIKFNTVTSGLWVTDTGYSNNGTTYYWVVYAFNGFGWGPPSQVWSFINRFSSNLVSPANGTLVSGTSITYSWNAVPGATFYTIYVSTTSNFSSIKFNTVTSGLSVTDTGYLNNGTTYYWVVYAFNGSGWGPPSQVWSFTNP